jgi:hypothetical protein
VREVVAVDRVEQLAALVDQAAGERLVGLFAVPRAPSGARNRAMVRRRSSIGVMV